MIVLLSPAKNLDYETQVDNKTSSRPIFIAQSSKLMSKLQKLSPQKIEKLMHISPKLAELNYARYQEWKEEVPPIGAASKQSIFAFNGEVYNGFSASDLSEESLEFAQHNILILSGLYGALRPNDLMQPYRLEMGTSFAVGKAKNLYQFWGKTITNFITDQLSTHQNKTLVNLASTEYSKVIDTKNFP